jgi:protein-tyrosine phosphatase
VSRLRRKAGESPGTRSSPLVPPGPLAGRPYRIVFVCTGNICRSPMAEVITRSLAADTRLEDGSTMADYLEVRSAGTGPWHEGEPMHPLAAEALVRGGYPRHRHVARQFTKSEMGRIDLIVALDRRHRQTLRGLGADPERLALLRSFDTAAGAAADVPDPYYGDQVVFDECRDMIAAACGGLVASLTDHWDRLWAA